MSSIHDVAERAGVSIATVSHVINGTRKVSPETTARVEKSITAMKYRPNAIARSLRTSAGKTIGMLVPDNANPFFAETARGVEDFAFAAGYGVLLCNTDGSVEKEARYGDALIENQVGGVILITAGPTSDVVDDLLRRNIPVVVVDRELPRDDVDAVLPKHFDGAMAATKLLVQNGHELVACIASDAGVLAAGERLRGFHRAIEDAGAEAIVVKGDLQYSGGYEAAKELLSASRRPTAVFACNDLMAIGALRAAREAGLSVPGDLSVVGFDDIGPAKFTEPALTTVAQPKHEIGAIAAELLLKRLDDPDLPVARLLVDTELIIRESVGPMEAAK